ncbi:MAG: carotenoid 1,2-hydratase [Nitrospira sp.]|nr:carotenoid 1,2-hydratase [Nitrospira sp.]
MFRLWGRRGGHWGLSLLAAVWWVVWLTGDSLQAREGGSVSASFKQAAAGYRFEFPRDHGAHPDFRTEWWYYTGHLRAKDGRLFGFELTFFRRAIPPEDVKTQPSRWSITQLYFAHFALTDVAHGRFDFAEKVSRAGLGKAGADESRRRVWIDDWRAEMPAVLSGPHTLSAKTERFAVSLTLQPAKPPVIHGLDGTSRKGAAEGQASHYYSFTRLATTGTVTVGTERFEVTGLSWMDHEFSSTDLSADLVGWDWFSIQLEDDTELMLYRMRRNDGSSDLSSSGTFISSGGQTRHLFVDDFTITSTATWASPKSKAVYPAHWRITVTSLDLALEVTPLLADQELRTGGSVAVTYWEGAVSVSGTRQGRPIRGQGYAELTGYAERVIQQL